MPGSRIWRLNSTDEMLHAAAGSLGSSRIVQVVWRFPTPLSTASLEAEWHKLNQSRLSRRAVAPTVAGARRKWVAASNEEPLEVSARPLAETTVIDWIDAQVRVPLPVGSTALWRLAAAPYQGGALVSLTVPHFRADGLGIFNAIACRAAAHRPQGAGALDGDLGDALRQTTGALTGSARLAVRLLADPAERSRIGAALRGGGTAAQGAGSQPRFFTSTIFDVDAALWQERAAAHGGTVNSLFVEIAANLVRGRVPRDEHATIDIGIPMSLRDGEHDGRANALVVVPLTVPGGAPRHDDLRRTREATKALLEGSGAHSATLVPEPLWHLLPDRYAGRLKNPGAQQTDVIASNFGQVPDAVVNFAGAAADSVAMRTMNVPGLVPEKARVRASLCLLRVGDRMTVTATGMPDHFGDAESLHRLVAEEFAAWGLTARQWSNAAAHHVKES